jgi:hypothetical protein
MLRRERFVLIPEHLSILIVRSLLNPGFEIVFGETLKDYNIGAQAFEIEMDEHPSLTQQDSS